MLLTNAARRFQQEILRGKHSELVYLARRVKDVRLRYAITGDQFVHTGTGAHWEPTLSDLTASDWEVVP